MDPHIRLAQIALDEDKTIDHLDEIRQLINLLGEKGWQVKNIQPNIIFTSKDNDFVRLTTRVDHWNGDIYFHIDMTINDWFITCQYHNTDKINLTYVYYYDRDNEDLKNNASDYWFLLDLSKIERVEGKVTLPNMTKSARNCNFTP